LGRRQAPIGADLKVVTPKILRLQFAHETTPLPSRGRGFAIPTGSAVGAIDRL
jgi:hypothetical protein